MRNVQGRFTSQVLYASAILFASPRSAFASMGWGTGWAELALFFFTAVQVIASIVYLVLLRSVKRYDSAKKILHALYAIVSLYYVYILAGYSYYHVFDLDDKGIISIGTYYVFLFSFLLAAYSFKWAGKDVRKIVLSRTLAMLFAVVFGSWLLSPTVPMRVSDGFWSPQFGLGLWGPLKAGYVALNPLTVPLLAYALFKLIYAMNKRVYLVDGGNAKPMKNADVAQVAACAGLIVLLLGIFEPAVSGPVARLFACPRLILYQSAVDRAHEYIRWSTYYGFGFSPDLIGKRSAYGLMTGFHNRAINRERTGDFAGAISDYTASISVSDAAKFKPVYQYMEMSWLLSTCSQEEIRNGMRATEYADKAIALSGLDVKGESADELLSHCGQSYWYSDPMFSAMLLDVLAAAYAEDGRFEDARTTQEKAYAVLSGYSSTNNEKERTLAYEQLESYRMHRPWRKTGETLNRHFLAVRPCPRSD